MVDDFCSSLEIRLLDSRDIAEIIDFRHHQGDHPLLGPAVERREHSRRDLVARDLENHGYATFGSFESGRLIAVVTSILRPGIYQPDWAISGLLVHPGHRGKHIGQCLIRTCCLHMPVEADTCLIDTYHPEGDASTSARRLYKKLGFEDYGGSECTHSEDGVRYFKQRMSAETVKIKKRLQAATPSR